MFDFIFVLYPTSNMSNILILKVPLSLACQISLYKVEACSIISR